MTDRARIGRDNRRNGRAAQDRQFKLLGIEVKFRGRKGNEESWGESPFVPLVRWEIKSGKMPALLTRAFGQIEAANHAVGRGVYYPAVALVPDQGPESYTVIRTDHLVDVCKELAELGNGHRVKALAREIEKAAAEIARAT